MLPPEKAMLSFSDIAGVLGVSISTIKRMIRTGQLARPGKISERGLRGARRGMT